ncbi:MAG: alternate F1F0 ATPase, F1 subunit alpha [Cyanobacteria bacterium SID2]|nr:alternate F1F0 ATPase, F1 subunit alpha [Cyanobacteria bacterium SID2]
MNRNRELLSVLGETFSAFDAALADYHPELHPREVGIVKSVSSGIAKVAGLPNVKSDELVYLGDNIPGIAFNLEADEVGVILLGESDRLEAGSKVRRTGRVTDVPVGGDLLGRVVDPTGKPLDGGAELASIERRPIEREAPAIMDRAPVTVPLQTGLKVIDALIPIGRGQRELIVGDRQTGKSAIAIDTIINQQDQNVICLYCAIGQRSSSVAKTIATLRDRGAMDYSIVVACAGEDPPGLRYIAPYAATTMAEYFMERGRDVLIVYDDLTRHAWAYRELSLLLRRPPGREAYPGDIFYLHSRMLERSTHLREELGGGSLTALPIVETQAQNISAYIPTNIISITDGQIYLSPDLFQKAILPAVDVGKSVSRVGGKTQLPAYRDISGHLRLSYAQFQEVEVFSRFGTQLDEDTVQTLDRGRHVREILKQPEGRPIPVAEQIAVLYAVNEGIFDEVPLKQVQSAALTVRQATIDRIPDICDRIQSGDQLSPEDRQHLLEVCRDAVRDFVR